MAVDALAKIDCVCTSGCCVCDGPKLVGCDTGRLKLSYGKGKAVLVVAVG